MSDRPTQETDAEYKEANDYEPSAFVEPLAKFLAVERERDEARDERDILRSNKMSDPLLETTFKHLIRERDEARNLADKFHCDQVTLLRERDEAREKAAKWEAVWEAVALREASIKGARICVKEDVK